MAVRHEELKRRALASIGAMLVAMHDVDPDSVRVDHQKGEITFNSYNHTVRYVLQLDGSSIPEEERDGPPLLSRYGQFAKYVDGLGERMVRPKKSGKKKAAKKKVPKEKRREYNPAYDFGDEP